MIDREQTNFGGRHTRSRRPKHPALLQSLVLLVVCALLWPMAGGSGVAGATTAAAAPAVANLSEAAAALPAPAAAVAPAAETAIAATQALTTTIYLQVFSARDEPRAFDGAGVLKGDPVTNYKFLISVDNTGDPFDTSHCFAYTSGPPYLEENRDPLYPQECDWPGVRTVPGWAPIFTQGTQDDLNGLSGISLPPGKYLISVMGDGYKVDGEHFTIPMEAPGLITVQAQPLPLPPAQMVIEVFEDISMTNGQFDAPAEHGLAGFRTLLNDIAGEVTVDIFGNPVCSDYERDANGELLFDAEGNAIPIPGTGGECISECYALSGGDRLGTVDPLDAAGRCPQETGLTTAHPFPWVAEIPAGLPVQGQVVIQFIGTIRWDVLMVPPDGTAWIQTTTLEGSNGWDTWLQEAGTGLDNEFVVAAEPFPWTIFGFVGPTNTLTPDPANGSVSGVVMATTTYMPSVDGLPHTGDIWGGLGGTKLERPISRPWVALNDLQNGDTAVWVGQGNADGYFEIPNVPPGNYFLTYWDEKQHYIMDWVQVTVEPAKNTDVGVLTMVGWFTEWSGYVFHDLNENGKRDPDEPGVADYTVVMRDRDNSEIDRMSIASVTDATGFYELEKGYPMMFWMVLEAYHDLYHTTGVTFQAANQPEETTILGNGVDVSIFPVLSAIGRLDWGVKPYEPGTHGGIAGTVSYDTARAEDDAAYAGAEPWQPGIPDLELKLWATVPCGETGAPCDTAGMYELAPDGSYAKGALLNSTMNENYVRPKGCIPRDVNGNPINFPSLPPYTDQYDCLEGPLMGPQFGTEFSELPGNWGFGEIFTPSLTATNAISIPMPVGDYLVEVVVPTDTVFGRPLYQVTREEDVNIYDGDEFYPFLPPSPCAGPLHIVDVADSGMDNYPPLTLTNGIVVPGSTPVQNPGYADPGVGGSRFEGEAKPLCNVKLVTVEHQKSIAPTFFLWTEVPIPGRWRGYVIDDLNLTTDPLNLTFGEKIGMANVPVGIYDFTGRLVETMFTDYHGVFEILLPSAATYNAPTPSGMLASVYYIYGNDPGQPGNLNPQYNPQYRSIGTSFEIYPGVIIPADLAPIQNGVGIWRPGAQQAELASCALDDTTPQLFAVDRPYGSPGESITIRGLGFGTGGLATLTTDRVTVPLLASQWADREITITVPDDTRAGAYQLNIQAANGQSAVNSLTIHVLGPGYNPSIFEVGPGQPYVTIQSAINAAAGPNGDGSGLVVVYPGFQTPFTNPTGIWFENPVIYSPVKLQGVGPGGVYTDTTGVPGTVLDGRAVGGDAPAIGRWRTLVADIWANRGGWDGSVVDGDGNPRLYEGPVITVFANEDEFTPNFPPTIDGFTIQGGDQQGFPANIRQNGGEQIPGVNPNVVVQGGGIFLNAYARYMQISNNVIRSNGGAYAAAIRVGTPHVGAPLTDHQNDDIVISNNRILANGGTNLAGAIGLFNGAQRYEVAYNDICGNFSAEYGGGISHYGFSDRGSIHHNRIYFNQSYDEGGGIMIAGELPANPSTLSPGAGRVDVYANIIQANLANDDGGGLRFLMSGNFPFNVYNNMIVNNISTHEGGGVSINDAPDVRVYNNTIMKNITTATAMTSNGLPAPAGLSTSRNSNLLQATLPGNAPLFSNPLVFNNIFWDNRAGTWTGGGVAGIGQEGDPNPVYHWDLGVAGMQALLSPSHNLLQVAYSGADATNIVGVDPLVVEEYTSTVRVYPWRGNPAFIGATIVALDLPPNLMGDYHIQAVSPAVDTGIDRIGSVAAPNQDFEMDPRPNNLFDIGADELALVFPATPILYAPTMPPVAAVRDAMIDVTQVMTVYLPIVIHSSGQVPPEPVWGGEDDHFVLDPTEGVDVQASGTLFWIKSNFDASQEVRLSFTTVAQDATRQDLLLKVGGLAAGDVPGPDTYLIDVGYDATLDSLTVRTVSPGDVWETWKTYQEIQLAPGDTFGARAMAGGLVEVYLNGEILDVVDLSAGDLPWLYNGETGKIGVWFEGPNFEGTNDAGFDNFGGGSLN